MKKKLRIKKKGRKNQNEGGKFGTYERRNSYELLE
jgi:hypothetical protein